MGDDKDRRDDTIELPKRRRSESSGQSSLSYASEVPHAVPSARHLDVDAPPVILDRHLEHEQRADDTIRESLSSPLSDDDITDEVLRNEATVPSRPRIDAAAVAVANQTAAGRPMPAAGRPARPRPAFMTTIIVRARSASTAAKALAFFLTLVILASLGAAVFFWLDARRLERAPAPPPSVLPVGAAIVR